jgi:hypothetical protein
MKPTTGYIKAKNKKTMHYGCDRVDIQLETTPMTKQKIHSFLKILTNFF